MKFTVAFTREVTTYDLVERDIEAPNLKAANILADQMAADFDTSCPDDFAKGDDADIGGWEVNEIDSDDLDTTAGYECRHDMHGYYICTDAEGVREDQGFASAGFDGRPHFASEEEAWLSPLSLDVLTKAN